MGILYLKERKMEPLKLQFLEVSNIKHDGQTYFDKTVFSILAIFSAFILKETGVYK